MTHGEKTNHVDGVQVYLELLGNALHATTADGWAFHASFSRLDRDLELLRQFAAMPRDPTTLREGDALKLLVDFKESRIGRYGLGGNPMGDMAIANTKGLAFPRLDGWLLLVPWNTPIRTLIRRLLDFDAITLGNSRWVRLEWLESPDDRWIIHVLAPAAGIQPARFYPLHHLCRPN